MPARRSDVDYLVDDDGCWIWQLSRNTNGYGLKWDARHKRLALAHRWHFEQVHGPVPEGLQVDHICNVRACVNPQHLEAVTPGVNNARKLERAGYTPHPPREAPATRCVDPADCVEWPGCRDRNGYGAKWVDGRRVMVHRWAYEKTFGAIPPGMQIDHLCRNKACYFVDHLEAVSGPENNRRAKWRHECIRGHAFSAENTVWLKDGTRKCRACRAESQTRYKQRRRERKKARTAAAGVAPES
jgi:hypothetical protein